MTDYDKSYFRAIVRDLSDEELDEVVGIIKGEKIFRNKVAELKKAADMLSSADADRKETVEVIKSMVNKLGAGNA